jgi:N-methylhydantoinase B
VILDRVLCINQGGRPYIPEHLIKDDNVRQHPCHLIRLAPPGGGGYGNPLERDIDRFVRDVQHEYISRETARQVYGVVFKDGSREVDMEATQVLRRVRLGNGREHKA